MTIGQAGENPKEKVKVNFESFTAIGNKLKKISSTSKIKCKEVTPLAVSGGSTVGKKVNGWISRLSLLT